MRIIVVDTDVAFTTNISQRCKKAGVQCDVFAQAAAAIVELKKSAGLIQLVLIAKELGAQDGLIVAQTIRRDPKTAKVPYIVMSAVWGKSDFAKHQKTEFGANAYFNKKSALSELESTIEAVTNFKFPNTTTVAEQTTNAKMAPSNGDVMSIQLEAASDVVGNSEDQSSDMFADMGVPTSTPLEAVAASQTPPAPPVDMQIEFGSSQQATTPQADASQAISIASSDGGQFELETSQKPQTSIPAPAAVTTPPISSPKTSSIDMGASDGFSIPHTSLDIGLAIAPVAAPPIQAPVAVAPPPPPVSVEVPVAVAIEAAPVAEMAPPVSEEEAAKDLPYLFAGSSSGSGTRSIIMPAPQMGSGSASNVSTGSGSDDVETLKKYLTMREQDVSVLTAQLSYAKEELNKSEETIKRLGLQGEDLFHQISDLRNKIEGQAQQLEYANRNREGELEQLRFEVKSKIDRIKFLEERLTDSAQQYEKLKERVRLDIRKIRVREKELESKLEILKKDSETLIAARENKILELKRKIDLLEFNYDTLQDKNEQEKQNVLKGEEKIERINKVLKLALGIIEAEGMHQSSDLLSERSNSSNSPNSPNSDEKVA